MKKTAAPLFLRKPGGIKFFEPMATEPLEAENSEEVVIAVLGVSRDFQKWFFFFFFQCTFFGEMSLSHASFATCQESKNYRDDMKSCTCIFQATSHGKL